MEIRVSELESVKEIICSAKISSENSREELIICHPKVTVTIVYGPSFERYISVELPENDIQEWKNGEISCEEIFNKLDEKLA